MQIKDIKIFKKGDLVPKYVLRIEPYFKTTFELDNVFVFRTDDITYVAPLFEYDEGVVKIHNEEYAGVTNCIGFPTNWCSSLKTFIDTYGEKLNIVSPSMWANESKNIVPCKRLFPYDEPHRLPIYCDTLVSPLKLGEN